MSAGLSDVFSVIVSSEMRSERRSISSVPRMSVIVMKLVRTFWLASTVVNASPKEEAATAKTFSDVWARASFIVAFVASHSWLALSSK